LKIEFINKSAIRSSSKTPKLTLLKLGKISINKAARVLYDLEENTYVKFGIDSDNPVEKSIYVLKSNSEDIDAYKVQVTGNHLLLNAQHALGRLGLDPRNKKYSLAAKNELIDGQKFLKVSFKEISS
jgi:hypothetical protein